MNKIFSRMIIFSMVVVLALSFTACSQKNVADLENVLSYSYEEFNDLAGRVDEKDLIKAWGEPQSLDSRRFWTVDLDGETKYVVAWVEDGKITSLHASQILFVNVAAVEEGIAYCIFGWDDYSTDGGNLAVMPTQDCFGNEIRCEAGDQYIFEFDGMIMETYPAQISPPYSVSLMGHLSEEEIAELADSFVLP